MKIIMRVAFLALLGVYGVLPLGAQISRGVLEGIVTDPQGAVTPGVKVTVTSVDTNIATVATTNATGYYRVSNLIPGKYRAAFSGAGFTPLETKGIEITAAVETRLDVQLKIGATRQTIEVAAQAEQVETAPTNFSTTVGTTLANELPLQGRDIQQLVFLMPGITSEIGPPGSNFAFNSAYGNWPDPTHVQGSDLEVNGGSGGANAWYLDGSLNVSGLGENAVVSPSPDAVEEFQAITSAFAAEHGHTGGGVFNVVLKSGGNSLHGNIYEYVRNSATNARNPFTSISTTGQVIPDRVLHFNDAGGTLGGPVYIPKIYNGKNRTFFFFSFDESILHLAGAQTLTVPTAAMRRGDFSEVPDIAHLGIYNPYSTIGPDDSGNFARSAFGTPITPGGCTGSIQGGVAVNPSSATCNFASQLPTSIPTPDGGSVPGQNPYATYFLNSYPLPNYVSPLSACPIGEGGFPICSNYLGTVGNSQMSRNLSLKIDHQWSEKNKFFGEWLYNPGQYRFYRVPWSGPSAPMSLVGIGGAYPMDSKSQVIAFGNTYTLSPTTINEFRASFSRQYIGASLGAMDQIMDLTKTEQELAPLNVPVDPQYYPVPQFTVTMPSGGLTIGPQAWSDVAQMSEAYTFNDNVTMVRGKHTLKTGLMYRLEHGAWEGGVPTILNFSGGTAGNPVTTLGGGAGLAEFLMGAVPNGDFTGYQNPPYTRWRYWGGFFQDDFRATSNLTLSIGLRYDLYGYAKSRIPALQGKFCFSCLNSTTGLPGEVVYPGQAGGIPPGNDYFPANKNDFAPRFNLAWTPFHDNRKTVIRAGYDVFYSDTVNDSNNPGEGMGNSPGQFATTGWTKSYYPSTCPSYTWQCVAFPLLPSSVSVGNLATPPYTRTLPAYQKAPLLGTGISQLVKPTRDPMVQRWDLEVERQLPGNLLLSAGYVGEFVTHQASEFYRNVDYVPINKRIQLRNSINNYEPISNYYSGTTSTALANIWGSSELPLSMLLTPYPAYSYVQQIPAYDANTIYHGLNVRVQKHLSSGFTFIAAYTNSKKITSGRVAQAAQEIGDPYHISLLETTGSFIGGRYSLYGTPSGYQNPDNRRGDRALGLDDIPQMFNFASTYELPFGKGKPFLSQNRLLNVVSGGWQLSGTFNAESGIPVSVSGPCDQITCRPNLVGNAKAVPGGQTQKDWINPAAFSPPFGTDQNFWVNYDPNSPLAYQWGTAGAVIPALRAPGYWNLDAALSKRFPVGENRYFQFRWEVFNALNHQNLAFPNPFYCLPPGPDGENDLVHQSGCQFGRITNVQGDPRAMEFALKFFW